MQPNGYYTIQSVYSGLYVGIENASTSSGAIMEQWEFDGGDYQKWILSYAGDGYYKIISAKSGLALSVQANKLGEEDEALVQELYDSEYRQQWKITLTSHGSFKIKARSSEAYGSDLVMCVGAFWLFPNGVDIEQRPYVDNTRFRKLNCVNVINSQRFDNNISAANQGNAEEHPDVSCGIKR